MMTSDHNKVLDWLTKDYETGEYWKDIGKEIHLASNGDSTLTRYRLADTLRRSMSKLQPGPVKYEKWNSDFTEVVTAEIDAPAISVSNETYVDWIRLADYLLLAAAVAEWPKRDEENQRRKMIYDQCRRGYEARMIVKAVAEYLEKHPTATDKDIKASLNRDGREILQVHISHAKKIVPHTSGREIVEQEPEPPAEIKPYMPLYF